MISVHKFEAMVSTECHRHGTHLSLRFTKETQTLKLLCTIDYRVCGLMTPGLSKDIGVMYDHTLLTCKSPERTSGYT